MIHFDSPINLGYGLIAGFVFGFLLQKGGVTRYQVIVDQFLLRDFTVVKTMLTAVIVGSVGVWALHQWGNVGLHIKETQVLANVFGGVLFGVGMALLGYCPGTGIGALGDGGSVQAAFGVAGMLAGAAAYAECYRWLQTHVLAVGALGKLTLPGITGLSPWWFVLALLAVGAVLVVGTTRRRASVQV